MRSMARQAQPKSTPSGNWFARLPGLMKMGLILGGGVVGVMVIGGVFKVLSIVLGPGEETTVRELPSNVVQPPASTVPEAPQSKANEATNNRERLWSQVNVRRANLDSQIEDLNREIQLARAQRWLVHAQARCSQIDCPSPYVWLLGKYGEYKTRVEAVLAIKTNSKDGSLQLEQKLLTSAEMVQRYRHNVAVLQDITTALTLTNTGVMPRTYVETTGVDEALDDFARAAGSFEALRSRQAAAAYAGEEGGYGNP